MWNTSLNDPKQSRNLILLFHLQSQKAALHRRVTFEDDSWPILFLLNVNFASRCLLCRLGSHCVGCGRCHRCARDISSLLFFRVSLTFSGMFRPIVGEKRFTFPIEGDPLPCLGESIPLITPLTAGNGNPPGKYTLELAAEDGSPFVVMDLGGRLSSTPAEGLALVPMTVELGDGREWREEVGV